MAAPPVLHTTANFFTDLKGAFLKLFGIDALPTIWDALLENYSRSFRNQYNAEKAKYVVAQQFHEFV